MDAIWWMQSHFQDRCCAHKIEKRWLKVRENQHHENYSSKRSLTSTQTGPACPISRPNHKEEERIVKTKDRQEDQDKNRSIWGRQGEAKDRQSWLTKERNEIDTLKKEKTL
jgi:hypothetical protein